jgi:hypothetical protein
MAIIQISKIQQRSGNIVDLPQLDEAEFGFATDVKKLYIGKESPTENIEVLTSYSNISFSQIEGAYGNLNIDGANAANGQVLTFTGTEWTNRGGSLGGLITLGNVANVKITGGQQNYSLVTDGTGNLSWAPTSSIIATIQNVTKTNPAVVTTSDNNYFTSGAQITITNVTGMTQLNGNTYYANVLTANTLSLYYDRFLTSPVNSTGYNTFPYTTVSATTAGTNYITVANSVPFTINAPVVFTGTTFGNITANVTYYVQAVPSPTALVVTTAVGGNAVPLTTASGSCAVYVTGGRIISSAGGGASNGASGGSNTTVQYNLTGQLDGNLNFTYDYLTSNLTLNGNANVSNLLVTGNAQINGDLVVNGNTTSVNIDTLNVQDPIISLGRGPNNTPLVSNDGKDRGEQLWYYTSSEKSAFIGYQNSTGNLIAATDVTITNEIVTVNSYGNFVFGNIYANNIVASGDVAVNGGDLTTSQSTFNLLASPANVNIAASGTNVNIGASTGITNVQNNLNIVASNLTVGNTTFNLANTTATTINFGGDATQLNIGNTAGNTTVKNNLVVNGNTTVTGYLSPSTGNSNTNGIIFPANPGGGTGDIAKIQYYAVAGEQTELLISVANDNNDNITLTASGLVNITNSIYIGGSANIAGNILVSGNGNITGNLGVATNANITGNLGVATNANITGNLGVATNANITGNLGVATNANITGNLGVATNANITGNLGVATNANITGNLTVTANLITTAITTGASGTAGTITGNWTLTTGSRLEATYADLAEYYVADFDYDPGTVLEFGGEFEVTLAEDGTQRVAGVVSTDPAYVMNSLCEGEHIVALALQGRVPTKVRGTIKKGDMLISGGEGYARPSPTPVIGTVIGKALENFNGTEGLIEVAISRL